MVALEMMDSNIIRDELNKYEFIVFAMDHYNPLGLIRSIGEGIGKKVTMIAEKSRTDISSYSKYTKEYIRVDTPEEGFRILMDRFAGKSERKPFLMTCDDKTIEFLDNRYNEWKDYFIGFNAGENGRITKYMNKFEILELASRHGLKTLDTVCVDKGVVPEGIEYPIITKSISPVIGGWKSDVHICNSEEELKSAYDKIRAPKVIIQKYIEKKNEYCLEGLSVNHGDSVLITIASTYNYLLPGYYSPYMTVQNMDNEIIYAALKNMLREIKFEGIYEVEFLVDQDDELYFSEINFRNSTWSYASTVAGMNLPYLWAGGMLQGNIHNDAYKKIAEPFCGMVEPIDYGKRVETGETTVAEWLADFKGAKCLYYYNVQDIEPFYAMIRNWDNLK